MGWNGAETGAAEGLSPKPEQLPEQLMVRDRAYVASRLRPRSLGMVKLNVLP